MLKYVPLAVLVSLSAHAKEVRIPDACQDQLCIIDAVWKKGVSAHTLTATLTTKEPIQSVHLRLDFGDERRSGSTSLNLLSVNGRQGFFFKVANGLLPGGLKWEQSTIKLTVTAIHSISPAEQDGVLYEFKCLGARLGMKMVNKSSRDLILNYNLLTITSGDQNQKLNGYAGKYIDLDKPRSDVLIPAGTTHSDELIPPAAAKFVDGKWVEYWMMHELLASNNATLMLPFTNDGKTAVTKIPLKGTMAKLILSAAATE